MSHSENNPLPDVPRSMIPVENRGYPASRFVDGCGALDDGREWPGRLTWPGLVYQMHTLSCAGLTVVPLESCTGYDCSVPDGWVPPEGWPTVSGLFVPEESEAADTGLVSLYDNRLQYARQQVEDGKDLAWPQAWERAVTALPDPWLTPRPQGAVWDRLAEVEASYTQRLANQARVIANLSRALEDAREAGATWQRRHDALRETARRCGLPIHRED